MKNCRLHAPCIIRYLRQKYIHFLKRWSYSCSKRKRLCIPTPLICRFWAARLPAANHSHTTRSLKDGIWMPAATFVTAGTWHLTMILLYAKFVEDPSIGWYKLHQRRWTQRKGLIHTMTTSGGNILGSIPTTTPEKQLSVPGWKSKLISTRNASPLTSRAAYMLQTSVRT